MRTGGSGGGGFLGKRGFVWKLLASGLVPVMMAGAYAFMAATSESDNTGKAWMALGFVFVLVLWWIFRLTTKTAALARAMSVGDSERILELTPPAATAQNLVRRAFAYEMRGEWTDALAAADAALALPRPTADLLAQGTAIRVGVFVETGGVAAAREAYEAGLATRSSDPRARVFDHEVERHAHLARGRIAWAEGDLAAATAALDRVMRDVRSGAAQRALAHTYAARIATTRGDAAAVAKHRVEIARLAPTSWMAREQGVEKP